MATATTERTEAVAAYRTRPIKLVREKRTI